MARSFRKFIAVNEVSKAHTEILDALFCIMVEFCVAIPNQLLWIQNLKKKKNYDMKIIYVSAQSFIKLDIM